MEKEQETKKNETCFDKITEKTDNLQGHHKRILLVEDDDNLRKTLSKILQKNGYKVFTATNGKEALKVFENEKKYFDLIFCDMIMPDKTGIQLISEIFPIKPDIKVLLSSGYTEETLDLSGIKENKINFLQKPYDILDLLRTLKEIVG